MTQPTMSHTPEDVSILPRNINFNLEQALATDWHGGDPFRTAFYNSLSIMFPLGEQQFIDSVKHYRDRITDPVLSENVRGFTAQESVHRREHQKYNEALCARRGYSLEKLEAPLRRRIALAQKHIPSIALLAATVAYEHWTAILADAVLRRPETFDGATPEMTRLWRWHAIEESEHKAVAFDVYRAVGGSEYLRRRLMLVVTVHFFLDAFRHMRLMLRNHKGSRVKLWIGGLRFLMSRQSPLHGLWRPWRDFFRRDFHPWDHDNRTVVATVLRALDLGVAAVE